MVGFGQRPQLHGGVDVDAQHVVPLVGATVRAGGLRPEVVAGREGTVAGAGHDHHLDFVVGDRGIEELVQELQHVAVERVQLLRPVEGNPRGGTALLVQTHGF